MAWPNCERWNWLVAVLLIIRDSARLLSTKHSLVECHCAETWHTQGSSVLHSQEAKKSIWRPACELFQWLSSWVWYGKSPRKGWTCVVLNREGCCLPLSPLPAEQQSVWLWLCSLIQQWHRVTMGVLWPRLLGPDCLTSCLTSENLKGNDFGFTAQSSFKLLPWTW